MGSDDLFNKRKARESSTLQRKKHARAQKKRYLIVCEGTKTEPYYFKELLEDLHIRQQVRIAPNNGVTPDRIVKHALDLYDNEALSGDTYDQVYCVFDRDTHTTFDAAVQRAKDLSSRGKPIEAITSTPCFEFWLLLHFGYTDQPFYAAGKKSVGDQVITMLRKKPGFNKYGKGNEGIYTQLKAKIDSALDHAKQLRKQHTITLSINPATDVDRLVLVLQELAA